MSFTAWTQLLVWVRTTPSHQQQQQPVASHFFAVSGAFNLFSLCGAATAATATAVAAAAAQFDTIELCYTFCTPFIGTTALYPLSSFRFLSLY